MIITYTIKKGQKPTPEQLMEIQEAKNNPITFDEDCEELSPAMMEALKSAVSQRNRRKNS